MAAGVCWADSDVVLILCAGDGARWKNYLGVPKQLAPLGGVPVLKRSIELVRELTGCVPVVVTADERLSQSAPRVFYPARRRWIVETLAGTANLWGQRTVVLLGDVFYSREAMRAIFGFQRDLVFFGRAGASFISGKRYGEIFAITFTAPVAWLVLRGLENVIHQAEHGARGKLRELLWYLRAVGGSLVTFHRIEDETDDFDSPADYRRMAWLYQAFVSEKESIRTVARIVGLLLFGPHAAWHRWKQWRADWQKTQQARYGTPARSPLRLAGYHHPPGAFLCPSQHVPWPTE
jgi:hypothetical protein